MSIANVSLTDTFDIWRTRTNQLIVIGNSLTNQTHPIANIAVAAFATANNAGNVAAAAVATIYPQMNAISIVANTSFDTANAAFAKANTAGGGLFRGNNGDVGIPANINDIFRINTANITANIVFTSGENASATGPLTIADGYVLEIQTGARVVII